MKGDTLWAVYELREGRDPYVYLSFKTKEAAEVKAEEGRFWAAQKNTGVSYEVRPWASTTDFVPPAGPRPRDLYYAAAEKVPSKPGCWDVLNVTVYRRKAPLAPSMPADEVVAKYGRNYSSMYSTFEPFRQNGKHYALISKHYTATSVLDLETGLVVASEEPHNFGFCPVGFYVPDYEDVHGVRKEGDESQPPGGPSWSINDEKPDGTLGFVWGCVWGDDNGWKVQCLDLSRVAEGIITRDDRFGYVEVDTYNKLQSPALVPENPTKDYDGPGFIRLCDWDRDRVALSVPVDFNLKTGQLRYTPEWAQKKPERDD